MSIFATKLAIESLQQGLAELRLEVMHLQSANKKLALEWEELYDKVRHQMARMSRRAKVDEPEFPDALPAGNAVDTIDPISAKILARRGTRAIRRQAE